MVSQLPKTLPASENWVRTRKLCCSTFYSQPQHLTTVGRTICLTHPANSFVVVFETKSHAAQASPNLALYSQGHPWTLYPLASISKSRTWYHTKCQPTDSTAFSSLVWFSLILGFIMASSCACGIVLCSQSFHSPFPLTYFKLIHFLFPVGPHFCLPFKNHWFS